MLIALDVQVWDRRCGRVLLANDQTLTVVACGDHDGRPCSGVVASYAVALDEDGEAFAIDAVRMAARPLGRLVSTILGAEVRKA